MFAKLQDTTSGNGWQDRCHKHDALWCFPFREPVVFGYYDLLLYPSQQVVITIEDVSERMDSLLKSVWGPHLYRIVMTVNNKKTRNKIIYSLQ